MSEFLEGTIDVPAIGRTKKVYVYVPVGLAGAYVLWRWYQASRATGEDTPAASDGTYSTDDLSEYGLSTTGGSTSVGGNTGSVVTDGTNPNAIDDNSEWTAAAVERLGNAGYDQATVYGALGEFLGRKALDKNEASIARSALAAAGQPPEGRPWTVIEEATTGGTGTLAAPSGLKATEIMPTSVTLTYSAVPGAASYSAYDSRSAFVAGSGQGTTIRVGSLTPNTKYSFSVAARSSTGKAGPKSTPVSFTTKPAALKAPTGLKVSDTGQRHASLVWSPVAGAGAYLLQQEKPSRTWESVDASDVAMGLSPNTAYRFRVAGLQPGTRTPGPWSPWVTARTKK